MKNILLFSILLPVLVLFYSCKKSSNESTQSAQDNSAVETEYAQVFDVVSDFTSTDPRTGKTDDYILPSGATVVFTDSIYSDGDGVDFSIGYGPLTHGGAYKGILCKDGRYRAGKINVGMNKRWNDADVKIQISISTANEYYVGNGTQMYKLSGITIIQRTGVTTYNVADSLATLQRDNGLISWNSQRTITKTYDAGPGWYGDEYQTTGTSSGTNVNGIHFTTNTITPLKKKLALGCLSTFIAGELKLTNSNGNVLDINYDTDGNQTCDKVVAVTYNGRTYHIDVW